MDALQLFKEHVEATREKTQRALLAHFPTWRYQDRQTCAHRCGSLQVGYQAFIEREAVHIGRVRLFSPRYGHHPLTYELHVHEELTREAFHGLEYELKQMFSLREHMLDTPECEKHFARMREELRYVYQSTEGFYLGDEHFDGWYSFRFRSETGAPEIVFTQEERAGEYVAIAQTSYSNTRLVIEGIKTFKETHDAIVMIERALAPSCHCQ